MQPLKHKHCYGKNLCGAEKKDFTSTRFWKCVTCKECINIKKNKKPNARLYVSSYKPQPLTKEQNEQIIWIKVINASKKHAIRQGYPNYADEFSSYCVFALQQGRRTNIKNIFIDFIRIERGARKRDEKSSPTVSSRIKSPCSFDSINDRSHERATTLSADNIEKFRDIDDCFRRFEKFGRIDKCILILKSEYGFSHREIAKLFDVTEVRISQMFKSIKEKSQ